MGLLAVALLACSTPAPPAPPEVRSEIKGPDDPHHKFLLRARSADGRSWERIPGIRASEASSPQVVEQGGMLRIYYVSQGNSIARVAFDGEGSGEPVIIEGQEPGLTVDPDVVALPDGSWRLYYVFQPKGADPGRQSSNEVRSARSDDGIHFTREPGIRLAGPYVDPDVVRLPGGSWRMFLTRGAQEVHSAMARDGLHFDEEPGARLGGGGVSSTLFNGQEWWMYLHSGQHIFRAVSPDGNGFSLDREPILSPLPDGEDRNGVESPSVARHGEAWWMVYASTRTRVAMSIGNLPQDL